MVINEANPISSPSIKKRLENAPSMEMISVINNSLFFIRFTFLIVQNIAINTHLKVLIKWAVESTNGKPRIF